MSIYASIFDRLKTQHEAISQIISKLDKNRMVLRPLPNKWHIHDNIAHLAKYQPVFIDRVNNILSESEPFLGRYKAEDDPEFADWQTWPIDTLLNRLAIDRKTIFKLITNLDDIPLNRVGIHQKYGRLTIVQWTEFFLLHEAHHIFTIFQIANDTELKYEYRKVGPSN